MRFKGLSQGAHRENGEPAKYILAAHPWRSH